MRKIIVVDPELCTSCETCELICSFKHYGEFNPKKSKIRIINWAREGISVPTVCWQCETPYCAQPCPTTALTKNAETGVVHLNYDKCIGCKMCINACPFGMIFITPRERFPEKCDLCATVEGGPWCVELCPTNAIQYIREDLAAQDKRHETAKKMLPDYDPSNKWGWTPK
ncbi:MAG: 4Fe-4S dicluster domain-containing protein [Candidatus Ranarchaeia archaeon]